MNPPSNLSIPVPANLPGRGRAERCDASSGLVLVPAKRGEAGSLAPPSSCSTPTLAWLLIACFLTIPCTGADSAAPDPVADQVRAAAKPQNGLRVSLTPSPSTRVNTDPQAAAIGAGMSRVLAPRPQAGPPAPPLANPIANGNAAALQAIARADVTLHLRPQNRTVMQIRGPALEPASRAISKSLPGEREERTARSFLQRHRELLQIQNPDVELTLSRRERDLDGRQHLRFQQTYQGRLVWPAGLTVHLDADGHVELMDGAYVPTPDTVAENPILTAADATLIADTTSHHHETVQVHLPELIVYAPLDQAPRLAWKVAVTDGFAHAWLVVIDAVNGEILSHTSQICEAGVPGSGRDLAGVERKLSVWQAGTTYYLADTSKRSFNPAFDPIKDPRGVITIGDAQNKKIDDLKQSDIASITAAAPTSWSIPDGVSAAFNFSETYDYFLQRHDRNSLDGEGGNITAIVRIANYDNASWNGNLKIMLFGNVQPYAGALDVVGHELVHGLTQASAGLVYENQPGALNESFSDIFGEMVEARTVGQNDWLLGTSMGKPFRNMRQPGALTVGGNRPYPSKMSEFFNLPNTDDADHGGVHINSSIINHAFYQLAAGLDGAIGLADAEKIFFRCLTQHLQPQSQFIDARLGAVASAEALFGPDSSQARKTAEAFDFVEILATPQTPPPAPLPAVQGPDSTLFLYLDSDPFFGGPALGRRETAQGDGEFGFTLAYGARESRPSVSGDGSYVVFVDGNYDLCGMSTDNPESLECLGFAGFVHAVALSPDASLAAFVLRDPTTGQPDNKINVVRLSDSNTRTFNLVAPIVDGVPINDVLYADSMTFSTDSTVLIYDAVSRIRFANGPTVERWSIYGLNLNTEKTSVIVPPLENIDTGNPALGRVSNRYLAFDANETSTRNSAVMVLDLFTGDAARVGSVGQGLGYPNFTGDESAVIFSSRDANTQTGFSLAQQRLGPDRLTPVGDLALWLSDATIGVVYRRGTFVASNALPNVVLTAPTPAATFNAGATIQITAQATDSDGTIARVEFYQGSTKLGETVAPPYQFSWRNVAAGDYRLIARAFDNLGAVNDSTPIAIRVGSGTTPTTPIELSGAVLAGGGFRLTIKGNAGNCVVSQSKDLRTWTDLQTVTIGASGVTTLDGLPGPAEERVLFYRARRP